MPYGFFIYYMFLGNLEEAEWPYFTRNASSFKNSLRLTPPWDHLNLLIWQCFHSSTNLRMVIVYHTPPSHLNRLTLVLFFDEFAGLPERLVSASAPLLIVRDFKFHVESDNNQAALRFTSYPQEWSHLGPCDHKGRWDPCKKLHRNWACYIWLICCSLPVVFQKTLFWNKGDRKLCSIDKTLFCQDIMNSPFIIHVDSMTITDLADQYIKVLSSLLERHAPLTLSIPSS